MATSTISATIFKNYGSDVTNLNTATKTGYGYTNSAVGAPSDYPNGIFITLNTGAVAIQFYVPYFDNTISMKQIKIRYYADSAWGSWSNIL